jgi:hypothetical protein
MNKANTVISLFEAQASLTLVKEGNKFTFVTDDGESAAMAEKDAKKILTDLGASSPDLDKKSNKDVDAILKFVKDSRGSQVDLDADTKKIAKIKLVA